MGSEDGNAIYKMHSDDAGGPSFIGSRR